MTTEEHVAYPSIFKKAKDLSVLKRNQSITHQYLKPQIAYILVGRIYVFSYGASFLPHSTLPSKKRAGYP